MRVDMMNENWNTLQKRAFLDVSAAEQVEILSPKYEATVFQGISKERRSPEEELSEDHYLYQSIYTELFDWLLSCEESLTRQSPAYLNADIIKSRMYGLQVSSINLNFF